MRSELNGLVSLTLNTLASSIPDPIAGIVIGIVNEIWTAVQKATTNKNQIKLLFRRVCQVLISLKVPQKYSDDALQGGAQRLIQNLESVLAFVTSERQKSFLRTVFTADDLKLKIDDQERQLVVSCLAFQNSALINANKKLDELFNLLNAQEGRKVAREDQQTAYLQDISDRMAVMQAATVYPNFLDTLLETVQSDPKRMLTSMQSVLQRDRQKLGKAETGFLLAGIDRLQEQTALQISIKSWSVTSLEVERGYLLGGDATARVRLGMWRQSLILMIELKDNETIERVLKLWESLRNSRITTFIGASVVDDPPFILTPYTGASLSDNMHTTDLNVKRIAASIADGLRYLHTHDPPVAHGSLSPGNISIDRTGDAFLNGVGIMNTDYNLPVPNFLEHAAEWLAPEVTEQNMAATPEADIYAFGSVVKAILHAQQAAGMTKKNAESLISLADRCQEPDPSKRPSATEIYEKLYTDTSLPQQTLFVAQSSALRADLVDGSDDHWRLVRSASELVRSFTTGQDYAYVSTLPIDGSTPQPLRKLCFQIKCHDQGAERTTASPRDGTYCWIEVAVCRGENQEEIDLSGDIPFRGHLVANTRHEVIRCPFADSTPRVHQVTWDENHPLVKSVRAGDRIKLYPKALYPGWQIYMYSAEMQVISEF